MEQYQNPICLPAPEFGEMNGSGSGIGDPFVYRFNGRYYFYPSAGSEGIIAWESEDMVNWSCVGRVAFDPELNNAYAPEIFYFNGIFYLITSPRGEGHYLYTSDSPTGPFARLTDNFGLTIDGSIFADDDGSLYFYHAENPSIMGHRMDRDGAMHEGYELAGTSMGHWTEGPGVFKRGGRYYITMTGNHLLSRGYRIDYAVSEDGPLGPWQVPENKTILVNTDYETGSLGHSSSVIGPDLDSYWIFYHSFPVDRQGKRRKRNSRMDRMLFPGKELVVSGPSQGPCPAPPRADFYGWADRPEDGDKFRQEAGRILSGDAMGRIGTAEVAMIPGDGGMALFSWHGEKDGIRISCGGGRFLVTLTEGGSRECLLDQALFEGFRRDVLHTLRVEFAPDETRFFVDQMLQGTVRAMDASGFIGAQEADTVSWVAFHGQVGQSGDRLHYNCIPGKLYALLALPGSDGQVFTGADEKQHLLLRAGETIRFRLNVEHGGAYHVQALMQASCDAVIGFRFETGDFTAKAGRMESIQRRELSVIALEAGTQECALSVEEGELLVHSLELFPAAEPERAEYRGLELCKKADQMEGDASIERMEGMQMDRRGDVISRFGNRFHTDGYLEADLLFYEFDPEEPAGLFMRVSEDSSYSAQAPVCHRGYFVGFDGREMFLWRMDFWKKELWRQRCPLLPQRDYRIRMEICGGRITLWVDGARIVTVTERDPLPYGRTGTGSFGARILVKRLEYDLK